MATSSYFLVSKPFRERVIPNCLDLILTTSSLCKSEIMIVYGKSQNMACFELEY